MIALEKNVESDCFKIPKNNIILEEEIQVEEVEIEKSEGDKKWECTECGKKYNRKAKLEEHNRTHSGERPFKCDYKNCGSTFIKKYHLERHQASHSNEKPWKCDECDNSYKLKQGLTRHKLTHKNNDPKIYKCTVENCHSSFKKKNQLRKHLCEHNGELPYLCNHKNCDKKFKHPSQLKSHQLTHQGKEKHQCIHCEETFKNYKTLTSHTNSQHSTVDCPYCHQSIKKTHLKKHIQTSHALLLLSQNTENSETKDEIEEPKELKFFSCDFPNCKKVFSTMGNLNVHKDAIHHKKVLNCPFCDSTFTYRSSYTKHLTKFHPEETKEQQTNKNKKRSNRVEEKNKKNEKKRKTTIEKD